MIVTYRGKTPIIGRDVFIAPNATVIGDVTIADGASIWYGAVIRGDMASISIGGRTNIQDNAVIHVDEGVPATIGEDVTIGHNAIVHGCTLHDHCLVGMGAVVQNEAVIHSGAVVAAGTVVRQGQEVGPYQVAAGVPAVVKKTLTPADTHVFKRPADEYRALAAAHRDRTVIAAEPSGRTDGRAAGHAVTMVPVGTVRVSGDRVWIEVDPSLTDALVGIEAFSHIVVLWWFHENDTPEMRRRLQVHPCHNPENPLTGVFATHSPMRPNLIGLSRCRLKGVEDNRLILDDIDARDGTPVMDIKSYFPYTDDDAVRTPRWKGHAARDAE